MKYTSLIGKKVVSVYDGKIDSYVLNITFNKLGKISKFIVSDIAEENTKIITLKNIFKIGENAILVGNLTKFIVSDINSNFSYIGKEVFCTDGCSLGKVLDIEITNNKICKIETENGNFELKDIISQNEVIVINKNTHYKKFNFSPKHTKSVLTESTEKVSILSTKIPVRITSHNLVGKKLFKDLTGYGGEVLATKNSFVTSTLINIAKQHNVLTELSRSVL